MTSQAAIPDIPRANERLFPVLLEIMGAISEQNLDTLLQTITRGSSTVLEADRSTLFVVDRVKKQIWSKVAQGAGMAEIRIPIGAGIAGQVALTGEVINIPDAYADPRFNREVDKKTGYRTRSILCMPMKDAGGKIIGVFQILNKLSGAFTTADEQLLSAFASQAAVAVKNAMLNDEIRKRMEVSETLLKVMKSVASELHIDELLKKIVNSTSEVMNAERASLFLVDPKSGDLCQRLRKAWTRWKFAFPWEWASPDTWPPPGLPSTSKTPIPTRASIPKSISGPASALAAFSACRCATMPATSSARCRC